jgi:NADH:ubiquinone oxidoreductase subunit E
MRSNSTTTKPTPTTDRRTKAAATDKKIRNLIARLLRDDDDDQARALITLVQLISEERDFIERDFIAYVARSTAFTYTHAFSKACQDFAKKA